MPPADSQALADQALVWSYGQLQYLLHREQIKIYDRFKAKRTRKFVLNCGRRFGKSYFLLVLALETCLQKPKIYVRYAAPTAKQVATIVKPILGKILDECPEHLRPEWRVAEGILIFKNGSELHIQGCDSGNAERLRGSEADLLIVDEARDIADLDYIIKDILMPQLLSTGGRLLLASTPPKSPAHVFAVYAQEAEQEGYYAHCTVHDYIDIIAKRLRQNPKDLLDEFIKESGGENTSTWKREYLAQFVVESNVAVVPEFQDMEATIVREVERPAYYDAYVGMDLGFLDLTVALFAYWDFMQAKLVIEDEVVLQRMTTQTLAEQLKAKEKELWQGKPPHSRVSDVDHIVINDLAKLHGIKFSPARKDDKEAQVNQLRLWVGKGQILIHPRCKTLIAHLRHAIWNDARTKFDQSDQNGMAHFDAVDALVYLVRNVQKGRNPYPVLDPSINQYTHHIAPGLKHATHNDKVAKRMLTGAYARRVRR